MKGKLQSLYKVLNTSTLRKSSVTFSGTVVNAIFGAFFYILAARYLGPSGFGVMTVAISVLTLTSDMGDLGTDTGLVNFVSKYINTEKEKAYRFLKLGLKVKLYVWVFVVLLSLVTTQYIANNIFLKPELLIPIRIAAVGVGSLLLFSFIIHTLQSMQRFWEWSLIQVGTNFLRLILFVLVTYMGIISVDITIWIYILVPLIGFFAGLKMIGFKFLKINNEWSESRDFFKYNKWVAVFMIVSAISARMDTFISARLLSSVDVGIYSAANQLVKIVPQIVVALGTVIGPKMAELRNINEFVSYFKKTQMFVIGMALLGLVAVPFVIYLIPYIFGREYLASGSVFVILFFAMLIFLISVPVHMAALYYFSYPKLFFGVGLIHLFFVVIMGWVMVNSFGLMGLAYTVLAGQILDFIIPSYFVFQKIRNLDRGI